MKKRLDVLGEDALKEKYVRQFSSLIFSAFLEFIDQPVNDQRVALYTATNRFLYSQIEIGKLRLKFSESRTALAVWVRTIGAKMDLNIFGDEEL